MEALLAEKKLFNIKYRHVCSTNDFDLKTCKQYYINWINFKLESVISNLNLKKCHKQSSAEMAAGETDPMLMPEMSAG
jgi:hypothetical protein